MASTGLQSSRGAPNTYFYPYTGSETYPQYRYVPDLSFGEEGEYLTDRLTTEALEVIGEADERDVPFFLHMAYHSVHTPIEAKDEDVERYEDQIRPGIDHQNPTYAAMVHSVDENVGRLLAKLDELDIEENTVVILTSDNGGYIGSDNGEQVTDNAPLRSGKGSLYEGGIRVPLLIKWPGEGAAGSISEEPVLTTDMLPTILDMTGRRDTVENLELDGRSLAPIVRDPDGTLTRERIFFHYPHYHSTTTPVSAVRSGRWKLLYYHEDHHVELYDLEEDLGEQNNLAPERPERARQLQERLHRWLQRVDAQMPRPNVAAQEN